MGCMNSVLKNKEKHSNENEKNTIQKEWSQINNTNQENDILKQHFVPYCNSNEKVHWNVGSKTSLKMQNSCTNSTFRVEGNMAPDEICGNSNSKPKLGDVLTIDTNKPEDKNDSESCSTHQLKISEIHPINNLQMVLAEKKDTGDVDGTNQDPQTTCCRNNLEDAVDSPNSSRLDDKLYYLMGKNFKSYQNSNVKEEILNRIEKNEQNGADKECSFRKKEFVDTLSEKGKTTMIKQYDVIDQACSTNPTSGLVGRSNFNVAIVQGTIYRREFYGPPTVQGGQPGPSHSQVPVGKEEFVITKRYIFGRENGTVRPANDTSGCKCILPWDNNAGLFATASKNSMALFNQPLTKAQSKEKNRAQSEKRGSSRRSSKRRSSRSVKRGSSRRGSSRKGSTKRESVKSGSAKKVRSKNGPAKKKTASTNPTTPFSKKKSTKKITGKVIKKGAVKMARKMKKTVHTDSDDDDLSSDDSIEEKQGKKEILSKSGKHSKRKSSKASRMKKVNLKESDDELPSDNKKMKREQQREKGSVKKSGKGTKKPSDKSDGMKKVFSNVTMVRSTIATTKPSSVASASNSCESDVANTNSKYVFGNFANGGKTNIRIGVKDDSGYDIMFRDIGDMKVKVEQVVSGKSRVFTYNSGNEPIIYVKDIEEKTVEIKTTPTMLPEINQSPIENPKQETKKPIQIKVKIPKSLNKQKKFGISKSLESDITKSSIIHPTSLGVPSDRSFVHPSATSSHNEHGFVHPSAPAAHNEHLHHKTVHSSKERDHKINNLSSDDLSLSHDGGLYKANTYLLQESLTPILEKWLHTNDSSSPDDPNYTAEVQADKCFVEGNKIECLTTIPHVKVVFDASNMSGRRGENLKPKSQHDIHVDVGLDRIGPKYLEQISQRGMKHDSIISAEFSKADFQNIRRRSKVPHYMQSMASLHSFDSTQVHNDLQEKKILLNEPYKFKSKLYDANQLLEIKECLSKMKLELRNDCPCLASRCQDRAENKDKNMKTDRVIVIHTKRRDGGEECNEDSGSDSEENNLNKLAHELLSNKEEVLHELATELMDNKVKKNKRKVNIINDEKQNDGMNQDSSHEKYNDLEEPRKSQNSNDKFARRKSYRYLDDDPLNHPELEESKGRSRRRTETSAEKGASVIDHPDSMVTENKLSLTKAVNKRVSDKLSNKNNQNDNGHVAFNAVKKNKSDSKGNKSRFRDRHATGIFFQGHNLLSRKSSKEDSSSQFSEVGSGGSKRKSGEKNEKHARSNHSSKSSASMNTQSSDRLSNVVSTGSESETSTYKARSKKKSDEDKSRSTKNRVNKNDEASDKTRQLGEEPEPRASRSSRSKSKSEGKQSRQSSTPTSVDSKRKKIINGTISDDNSVSLSSEPSLKDRKNSKIQRYDKSLKPPSSHDKDIYKTKKLDSSERSDDSSIRRTNKNYQSGKNSDNSQSSRLRYNNRKPELNGAHPSMSPVNKVEKQRKNKVDYDRVSKVEYDGPVNHHRRRTKEGLQISVKPRKETERKESGGTPDPSNFNRTKRHLSVCRLRLGKLSDGERKSSSVNKDGETSLEMGKKSAGVEKVWADHRLEKTILNERVTKMKRALSPKCSSPPGMVIRCCCSPLCPPPNQISNRFRSLSRSPPK